MAAALHTSHLTSLPLLARGKVRDNYAVGDDRILMVATDRISADYSDGVLSLTIPVAEAAKPRKIQVQHGTSGTNEIA